jgi:hypothetical protein
LKVALHEVADIVLRYGEQYLASRRVPLRHQKVLDDIVSCHTAAMGGHLYACDKCGSIRVAFNSCRNRHCPRCQSVDRERWIIKREEDLLPVRYFHVVFTLPDKLNPLCLQHPSAMYNMLFSSAWETLESFGYDHRHLGAATGMTAVLHTWGQTLVLHPHLHCIVPAGGLTVQGKWRHTKQQGKYLYPREALSSVFRAKYAEKLRRWIKQENIPVDKTLFRDLFLNSWVVDAREPFEKAENVIEYLARYTHKVAISNHRLVSIDSGTIVFRYKDYRDGGKQKTMPLNATDFLQRFCLHILPSGFVRIRHYGIVSTRRKAQCLADARFILGVAAPQKQATDWKTIAFKRLGFDPDRCPFCGQGKMVVIEKFAPERGPPKSIFKQIKRNGF